MCSSHARRRVMVAFRDFDALEFAQVFQQASLWLGINRTENQAAALRFEKRKSAALPEPMLVPSLLGNQDLSIFRHVNNRHYQEVIPFPPTFQAVQSSFERRNCLTHVKV